MTAARTPEAATEVSAATDRETIEAGTAAPTEATRLLGRAVAALGGVEREGQTAMAAAVERALGHGEHALIQAGTGTGKSLAYLVPAVAEAVRSKKRIVVSTATLALQRQVFTKDLPLVLDALEPELGSRPEVALFKGRSNYLCVHKMAGGYGEPDDDMLPVPTGPTSDLGKEVARLHAWADETETGDRDDLVPGVSHRAWAQVSVSGRECLESKCPMLSECFSQTVRDHAARAPIVVTNHAVLGVQAASHDMLGDHHALIVDEAHELVGRITSAATHELTLQRVDRAGRAARRCGVASEDLDRAARALDGALGDCEPGRLRLGLPEDLAEAVDLLRGAARAALTQVQKTTKDTADGARSGGSASATAKMATAALTEVFDVCEELLGEHGRYVVWLAPPDGDYDSRQAVRIVAAPLDVAGLIREKLIADKASVFTSATLALGGNFDAMARHLGVDDPISMDAGSPFDYGRQGILYVASHLPRPGPGGISEEALDELAALIEAAGGRTLGLFSSHRAGQAAAEAMRVRLDVPIMYQLDDQLPTLVERFREDPRACLFGSTSLWQGIDAPGETASLVVIDRIPFPRPDEPISQARTEAVAQRGGNGFMAVSATHAALLLAQGAGRLIRSSEDRGVVAVLDSRLATARYGGYLARSMPPLWGTTDRDTVLEALRRLDTAARERGV
ncbi:ATP-dependent DNA helicase [Demequina muriae]|uniref:ATP-dependent DNA helicase n=1 Tax=Demequina muriae TaxID=3051664 RepID=A0ABT8GDN4_9MICO|nr:ATP-dependent DNA helicase [Demequina sp. EGI L300058]MDN4479543.1 ATP-dependent DNA helicase [Demequina sp. EGI L300058]